MWILARSWLPGIVLGLLALARPTAAEQSQSLSEQTLHETWREIAPDLIRRAADAGAAELAEGIASWELPVAEDCQYILRIPDALPLSPAEENAAAAAVRSRFLAIRRERAESFFSLALQAARAHAARPDRTEQARRLIVGHPPLEQRSCEAIRLIYQALRENPEHEQARKAAGWVRRDDRWLWPAAARHAARREEYTDDFGWLPRGRLSRYQSGQRYDRGRWVPAAAVVVRSTDLAQTTPFLSDHWEIRGTVGIDKMATLARALETSHAVWRQAFGGFLEDPPEIQRRLEGRGRDVPAGPFTARLLSDRNEYVDLLQRLEPRIADTLGIYWTPTKTAWFFLGAGQEPTTVVHEATHQLFAEIRKTSPLAGERRGMWAIEAVACYMESLSSTAFGWTLGGRDAGRAPAARERLLVDGFYVPLEELDSLGRAALQADDRLPMLYSQMSGLGDFFMNGLRGRYREAFVEYLVRIYTGSVSPDTLPRLCGSSFVELDEAYRHHMSR